MEALPQPAPHKGVFRNKLGSSDSGATSMSFSQIQFQHSMLLTEFLGCQRQHCVLKAPALARQENISRAC